MKDFKSYQKNHAQQNAGKPQKSAGNPENVENAENAMPDGFPSEGEAAELARKALAAYNGKSEASVLLEILRQAEAGKRAGTLTNADIDLFYKQFSPMLEENQRRKFQTVIERLKKI